MGRDCMTSSFSERHSRQLRREQKMQMRQIRHEMRHANGGGTEPTEFAPVHMPDIITGHITLYVIPNWNFVKQLLMVRITLWDVGELIFTWCGNSEQRHGDVTDVCSSSANTHVLLILWSLCAYFEVRMQRFRRWWCMLWWRGLHNLVWWRIYVILQRFWLCIL